MNRRFLYRRIFTFLFVVFLCFMTASCKKCKKDEGNTKNKISNETTRLVMSSQEVDGVFNPFYSSSGADSSIVGMTQISMLSSDKDGKIAYGENEPVVVLDLEQVENGSGENKTTTYKFVLKNNVQFSNGSYLTMKDVLFNLYEYLDPVYYGSATLYSTNIIGLMEYRTQTANENEQKKFEENFANLADDRVQRLIDIATEVFDQIKKSMTADEFRSELVKMAKEYGDEYKTVGEDFDLACQMFKEELETDYTNNLDSYDTIRYTNEKTGKEVALTNDVEAFLFAEGYITWNKKEGAFEYAFGEASKKWTKQQAIDNVYNTNIPKEIIGVVSGWGTASRIRTYFANIEKENYFNSIEREFKNISGIQFANRQEPVTVNGKTYGVPTYDANGKVNNDTNEVLTITIKDVDPKAIWNFGFTVAPMYYYSNQEQIDKFDYESNFGLQYSSQTFQDKVIRDKDKIGLPVGAGAYKASTASGDSSKATSATFKENNVIYFERNDYFLLGKPKIRYINYQVIPQNQLTAALYSGQVHFVEPSAKNEIITELNNKKKNGESFDYVTVMTNGYGYIGINPSKVPDLEVRQAIMHAINTQFCLDYYPGYSSAIYRPMSRASWAYPTEVDAQGQYYKYDETGKTSEDLVIAAGYTKNADGIYQKNGRTLEYTFTIAGDSDNHPAYLAMKKASEILNARGFRIVVRPDNNALKKLNTGDLAVWAAAWSSTIDPDMYQVYHMDSKAGSTENWGYSAIKKDRKMYAREWAIIQELSELIDLGRETLVQSKRETIYAEALDKVMELAVELPAYQRCDLYAYNNSIIDASSMTKEEDITPYNGPISRIWELSLKESE